MNPRLNLGLILVATLALASVLFATRGYFTGQEKQQLATPEQSRYYITNPVTYRFDTQGRLNYKLTADRSLYFKSGIIKMRRPRMHYYGDTDGYWQFHSRRGRVPVSHDRVQLSEQVRATHHPDKDATTHIRTSRAVVHPDDNRVTSAQHVVAHKPTHRIVGTGMQLNLNTNQLKVLHDAHVTYRQ